MVLRFIVFLLFEHSWNLCLPRMIYEAQSPGRAELANVQLTEQIALAASGWRSYPAIRRN